MKQRGMISLDILGGLFIMLVIAGIGWGYMHQDNENRFAKQAADHAMVVVGAADRWVTKNQSTVAAAATPLAVYTLTDISSELPTNFAASNVFGQTYSIRVYKNATNALETVVLTMGGETLTNGQVRRVASTIGGMAGFIDSSAPTTIRGVNGGWSVPVATYGASPGVGHFAVAVFLAASGVNDLYVYRGPVAGHPEYNTMTTPLIMAATNIVGTACTSIGAISRDGGGKVISCNGAVWKSQGSMYWEDPVATFASLPTCNAAVAWQTRVVQSPNVGTGPRAYTCDGVLAWLPLAVDDNGNLTVAANLAVGNAFGVGVSTVSAVGSACASGAVAKTAAGGILYCDTNTLTYRAASPGEVVANTLLVTGVAVEGTACPNGVADNRRIAGDANGLILSCQSGIWQKAGGTTAVVDSTSGYVNGYCVLSGTIGVSFKRIGATVYWMAPNNSFTTWRPLDGSSTACFSGGHIGGNNYQISEYCVGGSSCVAHVP